MARYSNTQTDGYMFRVRRSAGQEQDVLWRMDNASFVLLAGDDTNDLGLTEPWTVRVEVDASAIKGFAPVGTERRSVSDGTYSGQLKCGIYGGTSDPGSLATGDSFEGKDLRVTSHALTLLGVG